MNSEARIARLTASNFSAQAPIRQVDRSGKTLDASRPTIMHQTVNRTRGTRMAVPSYQIQYFPNEQVL